MVFILGWAESINVTLGSFLWVMEIVYLEGETKTIFLLYNI